MISRRTLLLALAVLPSSLKGCGPMRLTIDASVEDLKRQLTAQLIGMPVDDVTQALTVAGARDVVLTDFGAGELVPDIQLDDIRTGEPVVVVVFGLGRGDVRPDRRARMVLRYNPMRQITAIPSLTFVTK